MKKIFFYDIMRISNYIIELFCKIKKLFNNDKRFYYLSLIEDKVYLNNYCIHGLWPQYNNYEYPKYCKEVEFNINDLKVLKPDLMIYWKPKKISNPEKFWKHEWKKHGSCMFIDITCFEYFFITIELYKEFIRGKLKKKIKKGNTILIPIKLNKIKKILNY